MFRKSQTTTTIRPWRIQLGTSAKHSYHIFYASDNSLCILLTSEPKWRHAFIDCHYTFNDLVIYRTIAASHDTRHATSTIFLNNINILQAKYYQSCRLSFEITRLGGTIIIIVRLELSLGRLIHCTFTFS